ncbi:MAG: hypothetical protein ACRDT5_08395 [Mycobacterium sp.]
MFGKRWDEAHPREVVVEHPWGQRRDNSHGELDENEKPHANS